MTTRIQLTLFVPPPSADAIEAVRRVLDPIQFGLIPAHVTLCREDELQGIDPALLQQRLEAAKEIEALTLAFGAAEEFSTHGVLLPCVSGEKEFRELRQAIFGPGAVRRQQAHITLAHPRNPKAAGNSLAAAQSLGNNLKVSFTSVCRIRQDSGTPWQVLQRVSLAAAARSDA